MTTKTEKQIAPTKIVPMLWEVDITKLSWTAKTRILNQLEEQRKIFKTFLEHDLKEVEK